MRFIALKGWGKVTVLLGGWFYSTSYNSVDIPELVQNNPQALCPCLRPASYLILDLLEEPGDERHHVVEDAFTDLIIYPDIAPITDMMSLAIFLASAAIPHNPLLPSPAQ